MLLKINEFSVAFRTDLGELKAVDRVSLDIKKGEAVAIVGESGCGKSSVALGVMGLLTGKQVSVTGEVLFDNKNLVTLSQRRLQLIRGHRIAMVFQNPMTSLNPYLKVGLQVSEQLRRHLRLGNKEARRRAIALLEAVGLPDVSSRFFYYPHEFSGGMRQRVMLAMALSCSPDLLIADEPTTALDVTIQAQILDLIRDELRKGRMSLLLITHDLGIVTGLCDRVFVMYAGRIMEEGDAKSIYSRPRHPYTDALIKAIPTIDGDQPSEIMPINGQPPDMTNYIERGCVFEPRCTFSRDRCRTEIPLLHVRKHGRCRCHYELMFKPSDPHRKLSILETVHQEESRNTVKDRYPTSNAEKCVQTVSVSSEKAKKKVLLAVHEVVVQYPVRNRYRILDRSSTFNAVNGVSLELYEGEILGLAGESGCGKSTLVRAILRLVDPTCGNIIFQGKDITHLQERYLRKVRRDMQMIFQDPYSSLNPRLKAWQSIIEPLVNFKLAGSRKLKLEARELMSIVGLDPSWSNRYPHEFSGGQRQRIGIARALAQKPKVVFCDEPVSALDVSIQAQVLNLLKHLQNQLDLALIFISHDLGVIHQISDRVAVMYMGRIVEYADVGAIYSQPRHPYTRSLIDAIPIPNRKAKKIHTTQTPELGPNVFKETLSGCDYAPRCTWAKQPCFEAKPVLEGNADSSHRVACFYWRDHD